MFGLEFNITKELIGSITSFSIDGRKFYKDMKEFNACTVTFFKRKEKELVAEAKICQL